MPSFPFMFFVIMGGPFFQCVLKQQHYCQLECIQPFEEVVSWRFHGVAGQLQVCLLLQ